ncbi:MAG TPA: cytochrome oxidase subunit III, partial [Vicinamibacteria bacterium]|nr:cytochrome oxidase subunit III [Vicinamibacteria bacterium]
MATEILDARGPDRLPLVERPGGPTGRGPLRHGDDGGGGPNAAFDPGQFGLWAFLGTVTMLFIGFTSAYIVRRTGADWRPLPLPSLLWVNTGVLLLSSAALEVSRRRRNGLDLRGLRVWLGATALLASLFV